MENKEEVTALVRQFLDLYNSAIEEGVIGIDDIFSAMACFLGVFANSQPNPLLALADLFSMACVVTTGDDIHDLAKKMHLLN